VTDLRRAALPLLALLAGCVVPVEVADGPDSGLRDGSVIDLPDASRPADGGDTPLCGGPFEAPCGTGGCGAGACLDGKLCIPAGEAGSQADQVCVAGSFKKCGGPGDPCCAHSSCAGAACCSGQLCVAAAAECTATLGACLVGGPSRATCGGGVEPCGGLGQPCCDTGGLRVGAEGDFCVSGRLVCGSLGCAACGATGDPCCEGGWCETGCCDDGHCLAPNGPCANGDGTCQGTSCVGGPHGPCGGLGQPACSLSGCTAPFTVSDDAHQCVACGGLGEPCCRSESSGYCGTGYACDDQDTCAACGAADQPCCLGATCAVGSCKAGACK